MFGAEVGPALPQRQRPDLTSSVPIGQQDPDPPRSTDWAGAAARSRKRRSSGRPAWPACPPAGSRSWASSSSAVEFLPLVIVGLTCRSCPGG